MSWTGSKKSINKLNNHLLRQDATDNGMNKDRALVYRVVQSVLHQV